MYINSNIKFLRKHRNRTQDDVAFALNMKRSTLSGYENGVSEPNLEALVAFSKYFGIAIDTLVKVDLSSISPLQLSPDMDNTCESLHHRNKRLAHGC